MAKSADAFRTISEVAEILQVPAHVLRFWESKFSQVKPVKRAGGRRYYRPDDIRLLSGIRMLLHDDGMTIKGVQKILRERGTAHVADMAPALSELQSGMPDTAGPDTTGAEVLNFDRRTGAATGADAEPPPPDTEDADPGSDPEAAPPAPPPAPPPDVAGPDPAPPSEAPPEPMAGPDAPAPEPAPEVGDPAAPPLPPLPDLPDDPGDTDPAPPGALSALAGLRSPVPADLATRLSAIAARLHGFDARRHATEAPNTATGD